MSAPSAVGPYENFPLETGNAARFYLSPSQRVENAAEERAFPPG